MRRIAEIIERSFIFLTYAIFVFSVAVFINETIKYKDVKSWPYVEVDESRQAGGVYYSWSPGVYGPGGSSQIDWRYIEFKYTVGGESYTNTKSTPDGGPPPVNLFNDKRRVYYKPSNPAISVLEPVSYKGTAYLLAILFSSILALPHMFCTVQDWMRYRKGRKSFSSDSNET